MQDLSSEALLIESGKTKVHFKFEKCPVPTGFQVLEIIRSGTGLFVSNIAISSQENPQGFLVAIFSSLSEEGMSRVSEILWNYIKYRREDEKDFSPLTGSNAIAFEGLEPIHLSLIHI